MDYDFDAWATLYKTDRAEFDRRRQAAVDQLIQEAPAHRQHELRQLQAKLDHIHDTQTPLEATFAMTNMMWDSYYSLKRELDKMIELTSQKR